MGYIITAVLYSARRDHVCIHTYRRSGTFREPSTCMQSDFWGWMKSVHPLFRSPVMARSLILEGHPSRQEGSGHEVTALPSTRPDEQTDSFLLWNNSRGPRNCTGQSSVNPEHGQASRGRKHKRLHSCTFQYGSTGMASYGTHDHRVGHARRSS